MAIIHASPDIKPITPSQTKDSARPMQEFAPSRYSFEVFAVSGERKRGLRVSFLEVRGLHRDDIKITTERQGIVTVWPVYKEPALQKHYLHETYARTIISFQMFEDGELFAIARLFDDQLATKPARKENKL